jgi:hypothetical protein
MDLCDEMAALARAGVTHVVSAITLSEERELARGRIVPGSGGRVCVRLASNSRFRPARRSRRAVLRPMAGQPEAFIAVHCRQGLGRSPMLAAGLLVLAGMAGEDAWEQVEAARGVTVPETAEQRAWAVSPGRRDLR